MAEHEILEECKDEFAEIKREQQETKALVLDVKDNHLKHIAKTLDEPKVGLRDRMSNIEGKLTTLVWALIASFTIIGTILVIIDRIWS